MSIDLNWETLTAGPDGDALAHSIRDFIHTKFQSVPLPRFIKSVTVHDFAFGATPPELELKDITDPLPDFYEENSAAEDSEDEEDEEHEDVDDDDGGGGIDGGKGEGSGDYEYEDDGLGVDDGNDDYEYDGSDGDDDLVDARRYARGARGGHGQTNSSSNNNTNNNNFERAFGGLAVPGGRFAANGSGGGGVHGLRSAGVASTPTTPDPTRPQQHYQQQQQRRQRRGDHQRANNQPQSGQAGGIGTRLSAIPPHITTAFPGAHMRGISSIPQDLGSPFLGTSTPGIPGGTSNLHYFHSHLAGGLSGTQTPLAAVAGAQLGNNNSHSNNNSNNNSSNGYFQHQQQSRTPEPGGSSPQSASTAGFPEHVPRWPNHSRNPSQGSSSVEGFSHRNSSAGQGAASSLSGLTPMRLSEKALREKSSVSTFGATSSAGTSRPPTRDKNGLAGPSTSAIAQDNHDVVDDENIPSIPKPNKKGQNDNNCDDDDDENDDENDDKPPRFREPRTEDIQAVFRIRYSGDVKLLLTADILLDYPMPSFVGIPLRLSITGLSFDGVGVVAYIRKRVHFCFLSPEDALAAVGADEEDEGEEQNGGGGGGGAGGGGPGHASSSARNKMGGLLQEIRVESEIGQREGGKQSLKNVGKVERFVLEQVRRIFEEEFVYPSFWTFLV